MAPTTIRLSPEERTQLEGWVRSSTIEQRLAFRARLILRLARGEGMNSCARGERTTALTVRKWRERFAVKRLVGLTDAARAGKPKTYGVDTESRILAMLDEAPPKGLRAGMGRCSPRRSRTCRRITFGGCCGSTAFRWSGHSWCISTDPEFAAKAADVVGLYLNPP
ncbi:MAG: helix-turn-helix domain-containing protein, partial [Burkholderiaceae bacterium]